MSNQVHEYSTLEEENKQLREQIELLNQYIESGGGSGSAIVIVVLVASLSGAICTASAFLVSWWWLWR